MNILFKKTLVLIIIFFIFSLPGRGYSAKIRLNIFTLLDCNCATSQIPHILQAMAADFGLDLCSSDLPLRTSIKRIAIELGVISDLKSGGFHYSTQGFTLCFDSTTQEGIYINVISIHKGHDEYV